MAAVTKWSSTVMGGPHGRMKTRRYFFSWSRPIPTPCLRQMGINRAPPPPQAVLICEINTLYLLYLCIIVPSSVSSFAIQCFTSHSPSSPTSPKTLIACGARAEAMPVEKWGKVTDQLYFVKKCAAGIGCVFVGWPFNYSLVHTSCLLYRPRI